MEFRNHPIMFRNGVKIWPPNWRHTSYGAGLVDVSGEVGTLLEVFLSKLLPDQIYLVINTGDGNTYIGGLKFEKAPMAKTIFNFLQSCTGKPIAAIAALDLAEIFGE
jgi:hypothetical protein